MTLPLMSDLRSTSQPPATIRTDAEALAEIRRPVKADLGAVDTVIVERLGSDVALVNEISSHIVNSGGKRLRPLLVLLAARAAGYAGREHHTLAAVIEFIHTATLLHDDVVDNSSLRRGRVTANVLFGTEASVLVGDFLYSRAFQMMVDVGNMDVMRTMADTTNCIAEGEVLQLLNRGDPGTSEARYLEVIQAKTARLFAAAGHLGAGCAQRAGGADYTLAMAGYGNHLGTAYQLIDDVLDYRGSTEQIGKNLGDDLAEGKATLPLIHALTTLESGPVQYLRDAISARKPGDIDRVVEMIESSGGIEYTIGLAREHVAKASDALSVVPESPFRLALETLVDFAVWRRS